MCNRRQRPRDRVEGNVFRWRNRMGPLVRTGFEIHHNRWPGRRKCFKGL